MIRTLLARISQGHRTMRWPDGPPPALPERFRGLPSIDAARCPEGCRDCANACPTEAITESKLFEFSFTNRDDAIYTKAELVVDDDGRPRQLPWEDWSDAEVVVPSRLLRIDGEVFRRRIRENPDLSLSMLASASHHSAY